MQRLRITSDTTAYEFDELIPYKTYVYAIDRDHTVYIIDTFCGSAYMEPIKQEFSTKNIIIINTHYHFDHVWGNPCFSNSAIYAHRTCKDMLRQYGEQELHAYASDLRGNRQLLFPNHCFDGTCYSLGNDLVLLYTPGHTIDGISVYDKRHHHLYAGDTLELPLVQIDRRLLKEYRQTLLQYLQLPITTFHAGHTLQLFKEDVAQTLQYIEQLLAGISIAFQDEEKQKIHESNLIG